MARIRLRYVPALITFLVGVVAATLFVIKGTDRRQQAHIAPTAQETQGVNLEVPDARWVPFFFRSLDEHTREINLPSLRSAVLPEGDLEVRFWYDALPNALTGVILRRSGGQWSAVHLHGRYKHPDFPVEQGPLAPPKSGWEAAWERLVSASILTLPDGSQARCHTGAIDGIGYVIEINTKKTYRTYRYDNPQLAECNEAKQMVVIEKTLADEFGLPREQK